MKNTRWKQLDLPMAYAVVQGIVVDRQGGVLAMHRSANVRSAPNCWSFPSGLHDVGSSLGDNMSREIKEEYGLDVAAGNWKPLGVYENITGVEEDESGMQWHWIIHVMCARVWDWAGLVNREPDKHDAMSIWRIGHLADPIFLDAHLFHPSGDAWLRRGGHELVMKLVRLSSQGEV
jgi:ADP-ribose pyrophosphatase YjhB (NUDIX family)